MLTLYIVLLILNALCIPLDIYNISKADNETFLTSDSWTWFSLFLNIAAVIFLGIAIFV